MERLRQGLTAVPLGDDVRADVGAAGAVTSEVATLHQLRSKSSGRVSGRSGSICPPARCSGSGGQKVFSRIQRFQGRVSEDEAPSSIEGVHRKEDASKIAECTAPEGRVPWASRSG